LVDKFIMMENAQWVLWVILGLNAVLIFLVIKGGKTSSSSLSADQLQSAMDRLESTVKSESRDNREELSKQLKDNRQELNDALRIFSDQNQRLSKDLMDTVKGEFKTFKDEFEKHFKGFTDHQKEKFDDLVNKTEKRLEAMRETVDEKLQKTLNDRLTQSFAAVESNLKSVQEGLGEMKTLAQDVGGLKKVLSNVKHRGGVGEVQLEMLLEQILAPDQYAANVKTKEGSNDLVEFAIKLPGRDDQQSHVYLPIDAKFPKDAYDQLVDAYDSGDVSAIDAANKNLENTIKKMAKDIKDKYVDPPNTTDFAILFLPFESIYAEVIRRSNLLEYLQRETKVIVTGPTTLAAILNSLQMGFRTLSLQKRSSEVWSLLGAVKTEFDKFGGLLERAQKNIAAAGENIDTLLGTRTNAIRRKLKNVDSLPQEEVKNILPELGSDDDGEPD
jgi:DNA recombination protein RmuC